MATEGRAGSNHCLPVELANRLRQVPLFDYVSVNELFRIAGTARQVRYERGRTVFDAGLVPKTLQFLVDGEVRLEGGASVAPPGPLAFEELLTGRPVTRAIHAIDVAVTLSLTEDDFLTLLFDNTDVIHSVFRMVMDASGGETSHGVTRGLLPEVVTTRADDDLQSMEPAVLLQASPLLAAATSGQLLRLAKIATKVPLQVGAVLADEGDDPAIFMVVRGAVRLEMPGAEPLVAGPVDAVGLYETLADERAGGRLVAAEAGLALRIDGRDLFDLLGTDVELLRGLFGALLRVGAGAVESATPSTKD